MNHLSPALTDTAELLAALDAEQAAPDRALAQLASLRARHPALAIDLAWQTEEHDLRRSYDALVRDGERGTLAMTWCADHGAPLALRGMQRASQRELVSVDGVKLEIDEAMEALEFMWGSVRVLDRVIDTCIVKGEAEREPIELSDGELQAGVEAFRAARGLWSLDATNAWLAARGLTQEMLERIVGDELMLRALRRRVTAGALDRALRERPADFDRIDVFHFEVGDEDVTTRLAGLIRNGTVPFFEAAEHVLAQRAASGKGGCACGSGIQLSHYMRCQLAFPAGAPAPADAGSILVMRDRDKPYSVARLMKVTPATPETIDRAELEEHLFEQWLAERRARAKIAWNFGGTAI